MGLLDQIKRLESMAPADPELRRSAWRDRIAAREGVIADVTVTAQYLTSLTIDEGWIPLDDLPIPSAVEYREAEARLRGDEDAPPPPRPRDGACPPEGPRCGTGTPGGVPPLTSGGFDLFDLAELHDPGPLRPVTVGYAGPGDLGPLGIQAGAFVMLPWSGELATGVLGALFQEAGAQSRGVRVPLD